MIGICDDIRTLLCLCAKKPAVFVWPNNLAKIARVILFATSKMKKYKDRVPHLRVADSISEGEVCASFLKANPEFAIYQVR